MQHKANYSHKGFKNISENFYREFISRNPITASWMGEHDYDSLLPEIGAEVVEKNIAFMHNMRHNLESLPENELSIDEQIDRESTIYMINQHLLWEEDLQRWKMGRDLAMSIGDSIFLLFARNYAPLSDRVQAIISRLKMVPAFLQSGKTIFQKVPALWGEIYLDSARNLPSFLDTIENSLVNNIAPILQVEYKKVALEAKRALAEFANWLKHAVMPKTVNDWSLGPDGFQAMIANKRYGMNHHEITELANRFLHDAENRIENLSNLILGATTGSASNAHIEVQKRVNRKAPKSFEQSLEAFREAINRSRAFVEINSFATLPDNEKLEVIETPYFMAHLIPFSAYIAPEKTSSIQEGTYLLTRAPSDDSSRYNYADIVNCAIHEGYPGHHLQLTAQNSHKGKLRSLCENLELIEGWAGYCQKRVREIGFETSLESLFAHAQEGVFNATRVIADINLQTNNWEFNEAVNFLMKKNRIDKNSAIAEIRRQIQSPGNQLSGLVGEHILYNLKGKLQSDFKGDFTDKLFHDLIIYQGSLPMEVACKYYPQLLKAHFKSNIRS